MTKKRLVYIMAYLEFCFPGVAKSRIPGPPPRKLHPNSQTSADNSQRLAPGKTGYEAIQKAFKAYQGKVIFTFWDKGREDLYASRPFEVAVIEENWKKLNGTDWCILQLNSVPADPWNAMAIINYAQELGHIDYTLMTIEELRQINIGDVTRTPQYYADLVRLALLEIFGGIWIDASIILNDSLDNIFYDALNKQTQKSLAAFTLAMHGSVRYEFMDGLENWLIMAKKGSKALKAWRANAWRYVHDSPLRSENNSDMSIFDRPLFKYSPEKDKPGQLKMYHELRASMGRQKAEHRDYMWVYSAWKRTIIENPEFASELLLREAGPEQYGPLGHEHLLDLIDDRKQAGISAMMGNNRAKIAERSRKRAYGDTRYSNFVAIKFPSVIGQFRTIKNNDGTYKYSRDFYAKNSLLADLTKYGLINARKPPQPLFAKAYFEISKIRQQQILTERFTDFPGGLAFRFGYPILLAQGSLGLQ